MSNENFSEVSSSPGSSVDWRAGLATALSELNTGGVMGSVADILDSACDTCDPEKRGNQRRIADAIRKAVADGPWWDKV